MKQFLLLTSLILLTLAIKAQDLSIEPNPVEATFQGDLSNPDLKFEIHATVTNNTEETIELKWARSAVERPDSWRTQVCDNNLCYDPMISTNYAPDLGVEEPAVMAPNSSFDMIFYVLPGGSAGYGEYEVSYSYTSNPDSVIATAVFKVTVELMTGLSDIRKAALKVFPNPTTDYIELTASNGIDQLVIYNLIGRQVRAYEVVDGRRYNVSDLPAGIYLVGMMNEKEGIIKTVRLSKRSARP